MKEVDRVIYIGSNHKAPIGNLLSLANMNDKTVFEDLDPFVVKRVIPVDSAPHSFRCELIIICERLKVVDVPKASRRPDSKPINKTDKKKLVKKKHWGKPTPSQSGRSGYFPTEEMMRRYASSKPANRQEIDYQKRDSLYPPPLRGALYHSMEENQHYSPQLECSPEQHHLYSRGYNRPRPRRSVQADLARYSDFRRDLEDALDESTYQYRPGKQLTSRKLAYANALLEEGIRIASEVLDNDPLERPSSSRHYNQRPRVNQSQRRVNYRY